MKMYAIVENESNIVYHLFDVEPLIDTGGLVYPVRDQSISLDRFYISQVSMPDEPFFPGLFVLDNGSLRIADQLMHNMFKERIFPTIDPVPEVISASQFFRALWKSGEITFEECRAALKNGDLPEAMSTMIGQLPEEDQQDVQLILEGATSFRRSHELVPIFSQLYGMSDSETDELWRLAATL